MVTLGDNPKKVWVKAAPSRLCTDWDPATCSRVLTTPETLVRHLQCHESRSSKWCESGAAKMGSLAILVRKLPHLRQLRTRGEASQNCSLEKQETSIGELLVLLDRKASHWGREVIERATIGLVFFRCVVGWWLFARIQFALFPHSDVWIHVRSIIQQLARLYLDNIALTSTLVIINTEKLAAPELEPAFEDHLRSCS